MTNEKQRTSLRKFASFGLYLAILGALAAVIFFIIERSFTLPIQISLGVVVIGVAAFVMMDPTRARKALTGRQARYGSNALLMTIAFIGIVIVINVLVNANSVQWDLTEDKQNSLTAESIDTLKSLKTPVQAVAYYTSQLSVDSTQTLLQNYQNNSNDKFTFEIVDPVAEPVRAQEDNVTRDGTIVLKMEGRQEQVSYPNEEEITGALVRLANPGNRAVYFLTGHGEYVLDSSAENNYSQVVSALEAKNYTVNTLNLLASPTIPDDALAIIVAGSTKPLSTQEVDLIKAYQQAGGSLVYLAEPRPVTQFGDQADPMEAYFHDTWGINLVDNFIIDPGSQQNAIAISQRFASHSITNKMISLALVLPAAREVSADLAGAPQDVQLTELAYSSDYAWGETDFASLETGTMQFDQDKDSAGPLSYAVAGSNSSNQARVLVIGDAHFAESNAFLQYGNSDFILNGIDWAAEQENLINLTAHEPIQRIVVAPQQATVGLILFGSVFLLPGLIILTGITVWLQRKRRG